MSGKRISLAVCAGQIAGACPVVASMHETKVRAKSPSGSVAPGFAIMGSHSTVGKRSTQPGIACAACRTAVSNATRTSGTLSPGGKVIIPVTTHRSGTSLSSPPPSMPVKLRFVARPRTASTAFAA